ncbi:MAG: DUF4091 domain-containing protein [Desulfuromonadales bacterium]|nr:DUF4091 domain-containing protein [Desulfuromonadales bacterium]
MYTKRYRVLTLCAILVFSIIRQGSSPKACYVTEAFAADYESYTHRLSQSTASYVFWTTTPSERIFKDSAAPTSSSSGIKVYAAKNEFEPFQLVVKPTSSGAVTLNMGDFGSGIRTELFQVKYVNVISATDALGKTGPYPDPLWPLENGSTVALTAGENTAFWFSVSVPPSVSAGDYTANLTIGGIPVPVTLHVFNFQIPVELHVESKTNYSDNRILTKYGVIGTGANYWLYVDKIKQFFIDHRLTPRNTLWSGGLTTDYAAPYISYDCNGTLTDKDGIWGFDKPAERYLAGSGLMNGTFSQLFNDGTGFPSFQVATFHDNDSSADQRPPSFCGQTRSSADWYTGNNPNSDYNKKWWQYITTVQNYLRDRGYLSRAYYYFANEPQDQADYDAVAWYTRWLKSAAPDLKLMVSENPRPEIFTNTNYIADKQVDIWVPVLNEYNPTISHERETNHGEVSWIYFLYGTRPPYFNPITLDHPGIESKFTGWFLWKYRVKGIAYYQLNDWSLNPWTADPRAGTAQNGDTFMLYPPSPSGDGSITYGTNNHRLVPSIRYELMRDSLEDYEYLYLLNGGSQPLVDLANPADTQADKVITSTTSYTRDSEFIYNLRRLIGAKLGGEIATIPDIHPPPSHPRSQGFPGTYYINFQDPTGSPATTSTQTDVITGAVYRFYSYNSRNYFQIGTANYDQAAGYGWYAPPEVHWMTTYLSSGPNPLQRSIIYSDYGRRATFEFDLPNGTYNVTASVGWQGGTYTHNFIEIEGVSFVNDEATTPAAPYIVRSKQVTINDGKLTMVMGAPINNEYTMLNYLEIESTTRTLTCTLSGTGSGSVNSATAGKPFSCTGGTCYQAFAHNDSINLHSSPATGTLFEGWSGACSGAADCSLAMSADRSISAVFNFCPAKIGDSCHPSLTAALSAAVSGSLLKTMAYTFTESLTLDRGFNLTLSGGYDNGYANNADANLTTLRGNLSIKSGSLTVDKLNIQ